jgi:hypothetical protein
MHYLVRLLKIYLAIAIGGARTTSLPIRLLPAHLVPASTSGEKLGKNASNDKVQE